MAALCVGQELYYLFLFLRETNKRGMIKNSPVNLRVEEWIGTGLQIVLVPFVLKQVCNVLQMVDALQSLAEVDAAERNAASKKVVDEIHVSEINEEFDCDVFFPDVTSYGFQLSFENNNGEKLRYKIYK